MTQLQQSDDAKRPEGHVAACIIMMLVVTALFYAARLPANRHGGSPFSSLAGEVPPALSIFSEVDVH